MWVQTKKDLVNVAFARRIGLDRVCTSGNLDICADFADTSVVLASVRRGPNSSQAVDAILNVLRRGLREGEIYCDLSDPEALTPGGDDGAAR